MAGHYLEGYIICQFNSQKIWSRLMVQLSEGTTIARLPGEVWGILADFGGIGHWAPNVDHSCLMTRQSEGKDAVRRIQIGRATVLERIVEWEPEDCLAYAIEGLPPVVRSVTNAWRLHPEGEHTRVTLVTTVDAGPRPPQKVAAKVIGRVLTKASREMLTGLKEHVESNRSADANPGEGVRS